MPSLDEIERNARALMSNHGVGRLDFAFDNGKRRIGAMHYKKIGSNCIPFKISLSRHYAASMTMAEIEKVMLHEIAHALAPGDAHGPKFRAIARRIGGHVGRCMSTDVKVEKAWSGFCPSCSKQVVGFHRAPLNVYLCSRSECRSIPKQGRILEWKKNGVLVPVGQMPVRYYNTFKRLSMATV